MSDHIVAAPPGYFLIHLDQSDYTMGPRYPVIAFGIGRGNVYPITTEYNGLYDFAHSHKSYALLYPDGRVATHFMNPENRFDDASLLTFGSMFKDETSFEGALAMAREILARVLAA
jgi:hypothetical protein